MDAEPVRNVPPAVVASAAGHVLVARLSQRLDQITFEITHGLGVAAIVDSFVRHTVLMDLEVRG